MNPAISISPATNDAWLEFDALGANALGRRAMIGMMALFLSGLVAITMLAVFLQSVETQEEDRRRANDAEWLDQTLRFHFRRIEADVAALSLEALRRESPTSGAVRLGMLWRTPGVITAHGWIAAAQQPFVDAWPPFLQGAASHPDSAGALASLMDTTRGLQRAAYAGPLAGSQAGAGLTVWLAVPIFERGVFQGDYLAAVAIDRVLEQALPAWFLRDHAVSILDDAAQNGEMPDSPFRYVAPINLPGAQWKLAVEVLDSQPSIAPRAFFGVALACLSGLFLSLFFLWRDVVRRRQAEARLQTQMALRMAMERSVSLGLRAWDLNGRLLYVNEAFCRMVGCRPKDLLGAEQHAAYWPLDQGDEFDLIRREAAISPEQQVGAELRLLHADGRVLQVLLHSAPLTLSDGAVMGWIGSVLDITERRRIEQLAAQRQEKLEASGRLIVVGEVASTLAHELNQPLGALSSFASGLVNRLRGGSITLEEVVPVVERMERMADKAGRVIQRVNAFARRQEMDRQALELRSFVQRVLAHLNISGDVSLHMRLPSEDISIPADALLLEHALLNVVLNATEWAARSGTGAASVRVSLDVQDARVGLCVEDTGPGVPDDLRQQIFDAFTSLKSEGMGMGLSICRSIVEAHLGRITVDQSDDLGGARFTLWLPRSA